MDDERYVALAEVARPHGLRGELRLKVYNTDSDLLLTRPHIRLCPVMGEPQKAELSAVRRVPGAMLARLVGVEGRDEAEQLRGARIEVRREALQPTDADEFYHCDLVGCRVQLGDTELGLVKRVACYPTVDALVVTGKEGKDIEIPLHDDFIDSVDLATGRIVVRSLEGLD